MTKVHRDHAADKAPIRHKDPRIANLVAWAFDNGWVVWPITNEDWCIGKHDTSEGWQWIAPDKRVYECKGNWDDGPLFSGYAEDKVYQHAWDKLTKDGFTKEAKHALCDGVIARLEQ